MQDGIWSTRFFDNRKESAVAEAMADKGRASFVRGRGL
jgi:hypothetical protein